MKGDTCSKKRQGKLTFNSPVPLLEVLAPPGAQAGMSLRWSISPSGSHWHQLQAVCSFHSTNIYWKASVQDRTGQKFLQSSGVYSKKYYHVLVMLSGKTGRRKPVGELTESCSFKGANHQVFPFPSCLGCLHTFTYFTINHQVKLQETPRTGELLGHCSADTKVGY